MLEKGKKYKYEELEERILEAGAKVIQELSDKSDTGINDPMARMAFQMQNMMVVGLFTKTLLKEDDE